MADDAELFWPSLYARLAPSRYAPPRRFEAEDPEQAQVAESDAEAPPGAPLHFLTDFATLRRHIEAELVTLLNATSMEAVLAAKRPPGAAEAGDPFDDWPLVQRSILNYGLPAVIGRQLWTLPIARIEAGIRRAVEAYEPRLRPETLRVRVTSEKGGKVDQERPLAFAIEGEILAADARLRVVINSLWDPEKLRSQAAVAT